MTKIQQNLSSRSPTNKQSQVRLLPINNPKPNTHKLTKMDNSEEYQKTDETLETYYAVFASIHIDYATDFELMCAQLDCLHEGKVDIFPDALYSPGLFDVYFMFDAPFGETEFALIGYAIEQMRKALTKVYPGFSPSLQFR